MQYLSRSVFKSMAPNILVALLYIILAKIGLTFALKSPTITIFWPAGGFALAILLLKGLKYLPGIFVGSVAAGFIVHLTPWMAMALALANTIETYVAYWLATRYFRINLDLESLQDLLKLTLLIGAIASIASALLGPSALLIGNVIPVSSYPQIGLRWWMGDMLGIAFLTPFILIWSKAPEKISNKWQILEAVILLGLAMLMALIQFFDLFLDSDYAPQGIAWIIMLIAWSGLRFGKHITALLQLIIFSLALWSAGNHIGHYADDMVNSGLLNFWLFGMVSAIGGLAISVVSDENKKIHKTLTDSLYYQRALLDNFPFMVWLKDTESRFLAVNNGFAQASGVKDANDIIGKTDFDIHPQDLAERYRRDDLEVMSLRQQKNVEEQVLDKGIRNWFETYKTPVADLDGNVLGTVGFARDITERKHGEEELCIAAIVFESQEGMFVTDANNIILRVNKAFTKITGYSAEDAVGQGPSILSSGKQDKAFYTDMWASINNTGVWDGEIWNRRKSGEVYPEHLTITAVKDSKGSVTNYVATIIDITDNKHQEQLRLAHEVALRHTLVREVHHRIKNSLHGVTGLLQRFVVQYPELELPMNSAIGQVQSISVIHGLHGRRTPSCILLCEVIREISVNHQSLWQVSISVDIPMNWHICQISEENEVPLALVINELILNALKHNTLKEGVAVSLRRDIQRDVVILTITNPGQLSHDIDLPNTPAKGAGLGLVMSLMPEEGAILSWEQSDDIVITRLELTQPAIIIRSEQIEHHEKF
ncbi:PAS domain S-box protein [Methylotenera sp.]|uniref:PAS domain S-box protein n=1 Tax=Methylotenera sp. TaxID=2051956 RepID=UPI0027366A6B|nr:PAS domain S-box protein [Methylotenera sp.]MDP3211748.1 PAS domain S-box protein [Methylotenera sp.]